MILPVSGRLLTYYTGTNDSAVYFDGWVAQSLFEMKDIGSCICEYSVEVPNSIHVLGIKSNCSDVSDVCSNREFIIASTDDSYILTNSSWKCTSQTPAETWTEDGYDDSSWPNARSESVNDELADINPNARQIWTWSILDNLVYCRLRLGSLRKSNIYVIVISSPIITNRLPYPYTILYLINLFLNISAECFVFATP